MVLMLYRCVLSIALFFQFPSGGALTIARALSRYLPIVA